MALGGQEAAGLNDPGHFWFTAVTRLGDRPSSPPNVVGQEGDVLTSPPPPTPSTRSRERLAGKTDGH